MDSEVRTLLEDLHAFLERKREYIRKDGQVRRNEPWELCDRIHAALRKAPSARPSRRVVR